MRRVKALFWGDSMDKKYASIMPYIYYSGGIVSVKSTIPATRIYYSDGREPANRWEGVGPGVWCGAAPIARFVARWLNRIFFE